jgi:hypothetical protein
MLGVQNRLVMHKSMFSKDFCLYLVQQTSKHFFNDIIIEALIVQA